MVDETEFRSTYRSINELQCAFEKAILSRRSDCSRCSRFHLADREGVGCSAESARALCADLLEQLRHNAVFVLKLTHVQGPLPHAKEIRVQNGGLLGLQRLLLSGASEAERVQDIHGLVRMARDRYGDLNQLPYSQIIQSVASFEGRARRKRR